jgi:hypothetical protein
MMSFVTPTELFLTTVAHMDSAVIHWLRTYGTSFVFLQRKTKFSSSALTPKKAARQVQAHFAKPGKK